MAGVMFSAKATAKVVIANLSMRISCVRTMHRNVRSGAWFRCEPRPSFINQAGGREKLFQPYKQGVIGAAVD
jgi:hypothetical protein